LGTNGASKPRVIFPETKPSWHRYSPDYLHTKPLSEISKLDNVVARYYKRITGRLK